MARKSRRVCYSIKFAKKYHKCADCRSARAIWTEFRRTCTEQEAKARKMVACKLCVAREANGDPCAEIS